MACCYPIDLELLTMKISQHIFLMWILICWHRHQAVPIKTFHFVEVETNRFNALFESNGEVITAITLVEQVVSPSWHECEIPKIGKLAWVVCLAPNMGNLIILEDAILPLAHRITKLGLDKASHGIITILVDFHRMPLVSNGIRCSTQFFYFILALPWVLRLIGFRPASRKLIIFQISISDVIMLRQNYFWVEEIIVFQHQMNKAHYRYLLKVKDLHSYLFFNFLSWRKFVSSVDRILLPQLAKKRICF